MGFLYNVKTLVFIRDTTNAMRFHRIFPMTIFSFFAYFVIAGVLYRLIN